MKKFLLILGIVAGASAIAQPSTEVYLFDLQYNEGVFTISNPSNISNNEGYDNQPSFWPDGKSILYARTVDGQTEIARYFIGSEKTEVITNTLQGSEYSPTPMPDGRISSVRLDTTGLQLLYAYDLEGNEEVLVPELVIGYHAWINKKDLITFVLGEPATMQLINTKNDKAKVLAENVGRSLHTIPSSEIFTYVDKTSSPWVITTMDGKGKKNQLITTMEGSEDFCWSPSRRLLMGQGNSIYYLSDRRDWTLLSDLTLYGLKGVTRMSVSPEGEYLAIVVNK